MNKKLFETFKKPTSGKILFLKIYCNLFYLYNLFLKTIFKNLEKLFYGS